MSGIYRWIFNPDKWNQ